MPRHFSVIQSIRAIPAQASYMPYAWYMHVSLMGSSYALYLMSQNILICRFLLFISLCLSLLVLLSRAT